MRKNTYLLSGLCVLITAGVLVGCGNENVSVQEPQQEEVALEVPAVVEPVEISEADIKQLLERDIEQEFEIKSHEVGVTDESNSASGKYDLVDKVNVSVSYVDEFDVIPQTINKDVYFVRDAASGQWEISKENCKKWDSKFKKFGGTSWKMTTQEGDVYFRLRDTIEFFTTQPDKTADTVEETRFSTTILGAIYMYEDGEPVLKRMHVTTGILSDNGGITIHIEFPHTDEEGIDINLNDCEKIEREELPFTEEEFRETSDQLG